MDICNRQLTPTSAAPPTAASGSGAKPRNELEVFVMWLVAEFSNSLLGTGLQHRTNKNQQLNPHCKTTPEPRKSVLALHGRKGTKLFCQLTRTNAIKLHNPLCCPTPEWQDFLRLRGSKEREQNFGLALHGKQMHKAFLPALHGLTATSWQQT